MYVYIYTSGKTWALTAEGLLSRIGSWSNLDNDDDVYLIDYNMAVGYKIYLLANTDQLERHKYKMISIRKIYS
jgi:hypothetical protein